MRLFSTGLARKPPVIRIASGTFYRHHPASHTQHPNPPLFKDLSFEIPSSTTSPQNWCIVGPSLSGKTTLLNTLRGRLFCDPPTARSYPYLSTGHVPEHLRTSEKAIQYVGFDGERSGVGITSSVTTSAYLSARYESRREITDFSLRDYLLGHTELNPSSPLPGDQEIQSQLFTRVTTDLKLEPLLDLPVAFLSNGQGRRARIARALLTTPEVLLLDEPFLGLDPPAVISISGLLGSLADSANPRLVLSALPQDPLPDWITHLVYLSGDCEVRAVGQKDEVLDQVRSEHDVVVSVAGLSEDPDHIETAAVQPEGESLVMMDGCRVKYGEKIALGNWSQETSTGKKDGLVWNVRRGDRWGVFGPNGSGKTTLVALICSDHPQAYSLPMKFLGRDRLPDPTSDLPPLTFWDIQSRIGHSSPEVHQHMPRRLTVRQVVENAWAETFGTRAQLDDEATAKVEAALRWFAPELNPSHLPDAKQLYDGHATDTSWADEYMLGELSFSSQRVALLIRALIKSPDIIVLDEAFSGMDDAVRDKCMLFLASGETKKLVHDASGTSEVVDSEVAKRGTSRLTGLTDDQALICISHLKDEVPDCVRHWMCLPEANSGKPARFGVLKRPLRGNDKGWKDIWDF